MLATLPRAKTPASPETRPRGEQSRVDLRRVRRGVVAMLLVATTSGCFNYEVVGRSQLVPSSYLAVTLNDVGTDTLTRYLGPDVRVVRGRFMRPGDAGGVVLSVSSVENRRGSIFPWQGETVVMSGEFVRGVEERHPARAKSALLALASIAGFVVTYAAFGPGASGTTPSGGGRGPSPR